MRRCPVKAWQLTALGEPADVLRWVDAAEPSPASGQVTVRVRATAHYDAPVGDVPGETRRVFYVHRDADVLPGFPVETGASGESSPHIVDLDGARDARAVVPAGDGAD